MRDLDANARLQLRDSLVEMLWESANGPKVVIVQLCLAVADLAIQLLQWKTVIPDLIEKFSKTPKGAICLLELLKILPEEMNSNTRLALTVSRCICLNIQKKKFSKSYRNRMLNTNREEPS